MHVKYLNKQQKQNKRGHILVTISVPTTYLATWQLVPEQGLFSIHPLIHLFAVAATKRH